MQKDSIQLAGLESKGVENINEARIFIKNTFRNRIVKGTDRNDVSSSSHVIIDINCTL